MPQRGLVHCTVRPWAQTRFIVNAFQKLHSASSSSRIPRVTSSSRVVSLALYSSSSSRFFSLSSVRVFSFYLSKFFLSSMCEATEVSTGRRDEYSKKAATVKVMQFKGSVGAEVVEFHLCRCQETEANGGGATRNTEDHLRHWSFRYLGFLKINIWRY